MFADLILCIYYVEVIKLDLYIVDNNKKNYLAKK